MPTTPAIQSAPLPNTEPLQLAPGSTPTPVQAAVIESSKAAWTGLVELKGRQYPLVTKLSALDMCILQEAEDSQQFREIISAIPRLVQKTHRDAFLEHLLSDPENDEDKVELDDALEAMRSGLEQIAARPTDK